MKEKKKRKKCACGFPQSYPIPHQHSWKLPEGCRHKFYTILIVRQCCECGKWMKEET